MYNTIYLPAESDTHLDLEMRDERFTGIVVLSAGKEIWERYFINGMEWRDRDKWEVRYLEIYELKNVA